MCPFGVTVAEDAGIRMEDPKSGQSWFLSNQECRDLATMIMRRRKSSEKKFIQQDRMEREALRKLLLGSE